MTDDDRERAHALMDQAFDSLGVLETISKTGERSALREGTTSGLRPLPRGSGAATISVRRSTAIGRHSRVSKRRT